MGVALGTVTTKRHALKVRLNVDTGAGEGFLAVYHRSGIYDWTACFRPSARAQHQQTESDTLQILIYY